MYKYILFDLDGTLTDSKPGILNCVQYALEKMGRPEPDRDKLNCYVGPPLHKSFEKFAGFAPAEAVEAMNIYRERFSTIGLFENSVFEKILPMLESLKAAGRVLAVSTSKPKIYTDRILERYGLAEYFTAVVGCELDGTRSDKAEVIEETLRQLGLDTQDKEEVVMIGDREHDVIGAKENEIACVGVLYGYSEGDELKNAGADYLVHSVEELKEFLLNHYE